MDRESTFLRRMISAYAKAATDRLYSEDFWPQSVESARKVQELLEARPPARILDLACGTGAVTVALALKGFSMTAVDCTPAMLDVARRMAAVKGVSVEWRCEDMRDLSCTEVFDYVLIRDVVFGIFESQQEDADLIRRIALALKADGRCFFEVYNKEFALSHGVENGYFHDERVDRFTTREQSGIQSVTLYSHDEWRSLLATHGLKITKMDGWNWKGDPGPPPWRADYIVATKGDPQRTESRTCAVAQ
jgi:SAM-dependent methyltransferase